MSLHFLGCTTTEQDAQLIQSIEALKMDGPLPPNLLETWTQFLSEPHEPEDVFKHPILFPLQRQAEWKEMVRLAAEVKPTTLLDVGSDKGAGVWLWLKALPTLWRVISCEIRGTPHAAAFEREFPHVSFLWLPCSSHAAETVREVRSWNTSVCTPGWQPDGEWMVHRTPIDVLFLDGDKSWFHKDYEAYQPMMAKGGVVFFHDIQDDAPREAFELCRRKSEVKESFTFVDVSDWEKLIKPQCEHDSWMQTWAGRSAGVGVIRL